MQNNSACYSFDSKNKTTKAISLQKDEMNGEYLPKPAETSYTDPSSIKLKDNETLILVDGEWGKIPHHIGEKLYHKVDKTEMSISEIGKSPADYTEYTESSLPEDASAEYYNFSEQTEEWVFDIRKYKSDKLEQISQRCESENYTILPSKKRENVFAGSPASDKYPAYLKDEEGKRSIAKLNNIYQTIAEKAKADLQSANLKSEVDEIISGIIFPSEADILASILK